MRVYLLGVCVGLPALCSGEFHSLLPCVCSCAVTPIHSEMWACVDSNHQSAHRTHTHINHSILALSDILVPPQRNSVVCYSPHMFKTKFITWSNRYRLRILSEQNQWLISLFQCCLTKTDYSSVCIETTQQPHVSVVSVVTMHSSNS